MAFQTFNGQDAYSTLKEKVAHLLYVLVNDHGFFDGKKRFAATLPVYFLTENNAPRADGWLRIDGISLAALALLITESEAEEKD